MTVAVVTESQTCIPREMAEELGIVVLPYTIAMDGRVYRDGADIKPREFYDLLSALKEPARTSAVTPGQFLSAFEALSTRADGILVITIAASMSAAYNNAGIAAQSLRDIPVAILDSGTAAMAQGLVVLEAARAARRGASLEECRDTAARAAAKVELFAYISTFDFLRRSGRVTAPKAFAAEALSIKPVFRFKHGEAVLAAMKRSTAKGREYIADQAARYYRERGPLRVSVFHAAAPEEAEELAQTITRRVEIVDAVIAAEFTPVMGCHTGPGVVGAAFL